MGFPFSSRRHEIIRLIPIFRCECQSPPWQCWDDMLEYDWIAFRGVKRQDSIYKTLTDGPLLFIER